MVKKSSLLLNIVVALATVTLLHIPLATAISYLPYFRLYIGQNYNEKEGYFHRDLPSVANLSQYDLNDKTHSIKYNGIWLLYEHNNFNDGNKSAEVIWRHGFDKQEQFGKCGFGEKLSSVRTVGGYYNFSTPMLSFFQGEKFTGLPNLVVTGNKNNLFFNFTSLIIIGKGSWTFHEGTDYTGKSYCLNATENVNFFPNVSSVGIPLPSRTKGQSSTDKPLSFYSFRSVETGCYECDQNEDKKTIPT